MENKKLYQTWSDMKQRCYNPKVRIYKWYGGRGIKVCDRWKKSFKNFLEDMGLKPKGFELDRIDNDGNYEPSNCRWISKIENIRNSRTAKLSIDNVKQIRRLYKTGKYLQKEIAPMFNISREMIWSIINKRSWIKS